GHLVARRREGRLIELARSSPPTAKTTIPATGRRKGGQAMPTAESASRLCLVTPPDIDPGGFPAILDDALAGGDVASLIITAETPLLPALAKALVPVAQAHEVAALIHNDTRIAGHVRADGVQVDSGRADLGVALASLRP